MSRINKCTNKNVVAVKPVSYTHLDVYKRQSIWLLFLIRKEQVMQKTERKYGKETKQLRN